MEPNLITHGQWTTCRAGETPPLREALFSETLGSEVEITFTGRHINLPLLRHGWSGVAELTLDGEPLGRLDLYSPIPVHGVHRLVIGGEDATPHCLRLKVGADPNPASHGAQVFLGKPDVAAHAEFEDSLRLNDQLVLRHGQEGDFFVWKNDVGCSASIIGSGVWAPEDVALFKRLLRPGDVVFDVGANVGHHSVVYSKAVGPQGKVYCFEPQRPMFNLVCANLLVNNCLNAYPVRLALGDEPGKLELCPVDYTQDLNFGAVTISKKFQDGGETVAIDTLDAFVEREGVSKVDFIKLDVQTFELFVLKGSVNTLKKHRPRMFVEISPVWMKRMNNYDFREVYRFLADHGYATLDKDLKPSDPDAATDIDDESKEWDIIAVPHSEVGAIAA